MSADGSRHESVRASLFAFLPRLLLWKLRGDSWGMAWHMAKYRRKAR